MSSFKGVYQNFLASQSAALLNDEASLNYITTLTTINSAAAVVKHFEAHQKVLKKTEEKALNSVEGDNAICLEIETTIEFTSGGGVWNRLPRHSRLLSTHHRPRWLRFIHTLTAVSFIGISSWLRRQFPYRPCRYLSSCESRLGAIWLVEALDHYLTLVLQIHIVHFDGNRKIQTIRLSWDQGSLLKQIDVIGARARSWPIRDGKDQARLIASNAAAALRSPGTGKATNTISKGADHSATDSGTSNGARSRTNTNVTRDPHASLVLFSSHGENETEAPAHDSAVVQKGSTKPPQRYVKFSAKAVPSRPRKNCYKGSPLI